MHVKLLSSINPSTHVSQSPAPLTAQYLQLGAHAEVVQQLLMFNLFK